MNLSDQNVLFFTRTMGLGGTEKVVLQLCEIFRDRVNKIVVCSSGGMNEQRLSEMGIKHYSIPDIEAKSFSTISNVHKILKTIIENEEISVIHTHHRMAAFYIRFFRLYKGRFFINTSHNTFTNRKLLTRYSYRKACLVACGNQVKKNLTDYFRLPEVTVIQNAVEAFTEELVIDPLLKKCSEEGRYLIGNIGRLSEQKGMEYFIKAIPAVIEKCPHACFFIIGAGEDEQKLKRMADETVPENCLYFMGYRSDVQNLIKQLDLVVLSSLWEGLPLIPIEAFSVGKTIVATAVDGTVEIVKDGINGKLIEPRNEKQLSEAVIALIQDDALKKLLERNAVECYEKDFSFEKLTSEYVHFYQSL